MNLKTFFSKCLKFYIDSIKALNINKKFLVFKINAFELVAVNFPYNGEIS